MMVEILCGILSGSAFGLNTGNWKKGEGAVNYVSKFLLGFHVAFSLTPRVFSRFSV